MNSILPIDITYKRTIIVNVVYIGIPDSSDWVLVDAGVAGFADSITDLAQERFNSTAPQAIILTHGHFDHIGSLQELLKIWDVPVYAHREELPYLTGKLDYPEADPTVGGGLLAQLSPIYPHKGIDLGSCVQALPINGRIRELPEWQWIHTPGHTKGHISLFRDRDRTLLAGDAFITVKQESIFSVITQEEEVHGPPAYFTPDWEAAWSSVKQLEALKPQVALTGHGVPIAGEKLALQLAHLAKDFDKIAIPEHGRYVKAGK